MDQEQLGLPTACAVAEFTTNIDLPLSFSGEDPDMLALRSLCPRTPGIYELKELGDGGVEEENDGHHLT